MIELIQGGGVTSAMGFVAGGTFVGLKTQIDGVDGVLDLGILLSERPAALAATFTTSSIVSPSVALSRDRAKSGTSRAVVVNSGCANCCVGEQGMTDAIEMASLAAGQAGVEADQVTVCSTGVIGVELPMALIRQNMGNIKLGTDGGNEFARAIMTTDTRSKEIAVSFESGGRKVTVGGTAKGVGMIHPNMATMLCFVTTDAPVDQRFLQEALKEAVDASFNMIDVDGDQSTNDTVLLLANGVAGGEEIAADSADAGAFKEALAYVCTELAKEMVRDGEGAQRLMEVVVKGASSLADARKAAREVAGSLLVKAMLHGRDPNWGRVMMALGKSGASIDESKIAMFINEIQIVEGGVAIPFFKDAVVSAMGAAEVTLGIHLNLGDASAKAWGCDLTEEYVVFNSAYST